MTVYIQNIVISTSVYQNFVIHRQTYDILKVKRYWPGTILQLRISYDKNMIHKLKPIIADNYRWFG